MDRASRALVESLPDGIPNTLTARAAHYDVPLSTLIHRAQGRRSKEAKAVTQRYLYPYEEDAVVDFVLQSSALGFLIRMKYLPAIAFSATRHRPKADRPLKPPHINWVKAFETRPPEIVAIKNRPQDWNRYNIYDKVVEWFEVIGPELHKPGILPENVYNMDETGVMLSMLNSVEVLVGKSDIRRYRGARVKRTMVTAIECISADGRCLKPMIIWPASIHRANWTTHPTPGWAFGLSDSGFTNSYLSLQWLKQVFDPQTKQQANGRPCILIWDGFGTHETLEIMEFYFANNIILCRMPSYTSHKLQPCDVAAFGPLKAAYRDQVERMERGGVGTIGKQYFTYLYSPARERALTKRNILAAWRGSGLFPFNPDKVLRDIPKPPEPPPDGTVIIPETHESAESPLHHAAPLTPTTPVSSEGLASLLEMIKLMPNDESNTQRKERLQEKVSKAALTVFTKNALLRDQNKFLKGINNEGKVRRSTKSKVLGRAKVIVYEDLVNARAEDTLKEAKKAETKAKKAETKAKKAAKQAASTPLQVEEATTSKKRGRKRKSAAEEAEVLESKAKVARASNQVADAGSSGSKAKAVCYGRRTSCRCKDERCTGWKSPNGTNVVVISGCRRRGCLEHIIN